MDMLPRPGTPRLTKTARGGSRASGTIQVAPDLEPRNDARISSSTELGLWCARAARSTEDAAPAEPEGLEEDHRFLHRGGGRHTW